MDLTNSAVVVAIVVAISAVNAAYLAFFGAIITAIFNRQLNKATTKKTNADSDNTLAETLTQMKLLYKQMADDQLAYKDLTIAGLRQDLAVLITRVAALETSQDTDGKRIAELEGIIKKQDGVIEELRTQVASLTKALSLRTGE